VEVVFEADDIAAERDRVVAQGWPLDADLQTRPWSIREDRFAGLAQAPGQWKDENLYPAAPRCPTRRRREDGGLR
jgi:hypothetical protein